MDYSKEISWNNHIDSHDRGQDYRREGGGGPHLPLKFCSQSAGLCVLAPQWTVPTMSHPAMNLRTAADCQRRWCKTQSAIHHILRPACIQNVCHSLYICNKKTGMCFPQFIMQPTQHSKSYNSQMKKTRSSIHVFIAIYRHSRGRQVYNRSSRCK